ncbi:MAG: protein kinase [Myxococcota bacterium]
MASCTECGAKIVPGDQECPGCGAPIPPEPDEPDPFLHRTIAGKYEITELIGSGAMGRVYRARQVALDKSIAIKVMHKHLANDPKVSKRFHREARAASRLSHANSLSILDFGEDDDGTLYIAMEFLDGDDLLTVIEHDAPFRPRRILNLMEQVLAALDAAHLAGIIHRDLKPENVIVLEDARGAETLKVCDFGIAKIVEQEGGSAITVSGFVCGTPEYMAPEQARGESLDKRADIYAAGCMLYQMLTASLPFTAESALGIITQHLTQPVEPPRQRKPAWKIPRVLEAVCLRAMSKDRNERYADAPAMVEALRQAVAELGDVANHPLGSRDDPTEDPETESQTDNRPERAESAPAESPKSNPPEPGSSEGLRNFVAVTLAVAGLAAIGVALLGSHGAENEASLVGAPPPPVAVLTQDAAVAPDGLDLGGTPPTVPDTELAGPPVPPETLPSSSTSEHPEAATLRTPRPVRPREPPEEAPPEAATEPTEAPEETAYDQGRRLFLANDVAGAIRAFESAARTAPNNPRVHKQLGRAYMRAGDVSRARSAYRRYLELAPNASDSAIIERMIGEEP